MAQRLPNLGRLDLRPRVKTGADGNDPDPKRQKTSRLSDEDRDREVEAFVLRLIRDYLGSLPSDPQVVADIRQQAERAVMEMNGFTAEWPNDAGVGQGIALLKGRPATNVNLRKLREDLWAHGFAELQSARDRGKRQSDLQKKERMRQNELRDQDAADGSGYFNGKDPEPPLMVLGDQKLYDDLLRKAQRGDQQKWGEEARNSQGRRNRCCGKKS